MAGLHFDITGDNSNLLRKLNEAENGVRVTSKSIENSGLGIENMFKRIQNAAAMSLAGFSAQQFASQVAKVRGEFQQLEVAFNTMLGSKEQADSLMQQLVKTAAITPFDLEGVANGAKQLLAYGTASDKVNETLIRLGDIAAGLSMPLNDLVYLYGTTQVQGQLFTQDLRQFQGRGIPLAEELAKQFGVTKDKVGELVTAGKVGFPAVEKAIVAMTSEGGKFGGLMEAQSKTISGQISNIEDAIDTMFNKIGKENENIINEVLSGASYLVEHWEDVAMAIESAAVAYGTYKAAVMTTAALQESEQTLKVDTEIEGLKSLLIVKEESKNADLAAAVASGNLTEAKASELSMLREELAVRLSNLKVKEAEAIAEHESALSAFNSAKENLDEADEYLEKMEDLYEASLNQGDASYEQYAMEQLQTAMENQNTAATALNTAEKNLNAASSNRKAASEAVDTLATEANTVANNANAASMNIMKLAAKQLCAMIKGLWVSLMSNPLFLVASAISGLGFAIYKVATAENEAEKATRLYNEAIEEQSNKQEEYSRSIEELNRKLTDNSLSEGERISAFQQLKAEYPTILGNLNSEAEYLKDIVKYKKLIAEEDGRRAQADDLALLEEEERKLKYYQQVRENGTSTSLVDMDGNGWSSDNVMDAIKAQTEIVNKQKAKVAEFSKNQFLVGIKDMTSESIKSNLEDITLSLQALGKAGDDAIAIVPVLGGEYSKQQLKTIKQSLEDEQKLRGTEKKNASEWLNNAKSNYDTALKNLRDFESSKKELSKVEYEREHKRLKQEVDTSEKNYKDLLVKSGAEADSDKANSIHIKNEEAKRKELVKFEQETQSNILSIQKDGKDKELALNKKAYEDNKTLIEQKKKDSIEAEQKRIFDEEEAARKNTQGALYKARYFEVEKEKGNLKNPSEEYMSALDKLTKSRYAKAKHEYQEKAKDIYAKEEQAMWDFYQKYGTFQQKKLAIDEEYAEKIRKAHSDGERLTLKKQRDEAITSKETEALKAKIDWVSVFGDFGSMFADVVKPSLDEARAYLRTDEFKQMTPEQQKPLIEAINNLEQAFGEADGASFKKLGDSIKAYQKVEDKRTAAVQTEQVAYKELTKAQADYNKALKEGKTGEQKASAIALINAQENADAASANVQTLTDAATAAQQTVTDTATKLKAGMENVLGGMQKLSSGGLYNAYIGFVKTVNGFREIMGKASDTMKEVPIVGWILSLLDLLKDGIADLISALINSVFSAVSGILNDVLSGKLIASIVESLVLGIGSILNALTFGALGGGADYSKYDAMVVQYEELSKIWDELINKKKEYIDISYGTEALKVGEETLAIIEKSQQAQRNLASALASSGASAGSHSIAARQNRDLGGFASELYKYVEQNGNYDDITNALLGASAEQLMKVKEQMPELWAGLDNDFRNHMDNIISGAEQAKDVIARMKESVTGISLDEFKSGYADLLSDLDSKNEDFADNFEKYLQRAIFESFIANKYKTQIEGLYETWSELGKDGLTTDEAQSLRDSQRQLTDSLLAERDKMMEDFGWENSSTSQSSTSRGFEGMSQDSADELNGRFTALQVAGEEIKEQSIIQTSLLQLMSVDTSEISRQMIQQNQYISEIVDIQYESNGYLSEINKNTKQLYQINERLGKIEQNTNRL